VKSSKISENELQMSVSDAEFKISWNHLEISRNIDFILKRLAIEMPAHSRRNSNEKGWHHSLDLQ
jgi:hypothetical protein